MEMGLSLLATVLKTPVISLNQKGEAIWVKSDPIRFAFALWPSPTTNRKPFSGVNTNRGPWATLAVTVLQSVARAPWAIPISKRILIQACISYCSDETALGAFSG